LLTTDFTLSSCSQIGVVPDAIGHPNLESHGRLGQHVAHLIWRKVFDIANPHFRVIPVAIYYIANN
jgi:hypothetical protein